MAKRTGIRYNRRAVEKMFRDIGRGVVRKDAPKAVKVMQEVGVDVLKAVVSGPYSLSALADMDHPYAKRHPSIITPSGIKSYTINIQSRNLYNSISAAKPTMTRDGVLGSIYPDTSKFSASEEGYDRAKVRNNLVTGDQWLIKGTKYMHGRDFVRWAIYNRVTQDRMVRRATTVIRRGLGTMKKRTVRS